MNAPLTNDTRLAKSYIWFGRQCYFVSTIDRESSAALAYGARYAETIVWLFDWEKNERGEQIYQGEAPAMSIIQHLNVCKTLHEKGIRGLVGDKL